jgi:hypothetical protein
MKCCQQAGMTGYVTFHSNQTHPIELIGLVWHKTSERVAMFTELSLLLDVQVFKFLILKNTAKSGLTALNAIMWHLDTLTKTP